MSKTDEVCEIYVIYTAIIRFCGFVFKSSMSSEKICSWKFLDVLIGS